MVDENTIKELKNKLFTTYGIALREDDPAWLMIVIYNDLLGNVNKSISDLKNIPKISTQNQSILTALTELQTKTANLFETADNITAKTATKNTELLTAVKAEIGRVNAAIKESVDDAIKDTDINTFIGEAISKKISTVDLKGLDAFITSTNENIDKIKEEITEETKEVEEIKVAWEESVSSLESIPKQINDTTNKLNKKIASLGWGRFFAGLAIGATVAGSIMYVNSHIVYNTMFEKQEQERLKGLKLETQMLFDEGIRLDKKYEDKAKEIKVLIEYGIDFYDNEGKKYIRVKTHYGEKGILYNHSNKYSFIQIDGE